jgi:hypothetical protein
LANQTAPGTSFIRNPQLATTGLQDGGRYIQRGPDGRGGVTTIYHGGAGQGGGGGARAGWGNQPAAKKAKRGGGGGGGKLAPGDLRISHFFSKSSEECSS